MLFTDVVEELSNMIVPRLEKFAIAPDLVKLPVQVRTEEDTPVPYICALYDDAIVRLAQVAVAVSIVKTSEFDENEYGSINTSSEEVGTDAPGVPLDVVDQ
jgi:hypothetical protein